VCSAHAGGVQRAGLRLEIPRQGADVGVAEVGGQYASYLEHALQEYRSGKRKNAIMAAQAANLSDADIRALARYFESQPGPLYTPRVR
jgi:cytochrome c553